MRWERSSASCAPPLLPGKSLARESTIHIDFHAVYLPKPALPQIDNHVPVQAGFVFVSRLRVSRAKRKMHRPADLFIKQRVTRVARDAKVRADGAFTEKSAARVHVEHAEKKLLSLARTGIDHLAVLE